MRRVLERIYQRQHQSQPCEPGPNEEALSGTDTIVELNQIDEIKIFFFKALTI